MIFLDSNIFLRALTAPVTASDREWREQAALLFAGIESGKLEATTSEVVLHEVSFNLTSSKHYAMAAHDVIRILRFLLAMMGLRFSGQEKDVYLRALDLWEEHPKLEFSDAVIAARCEHGDLELASFDRHFDRLDHLRRWQPATPNDPA